MEGIRTRGPTIYENILQDNVCVKRTRNYTSTKRKYLPICEYIFSIMYAHMEKFNRILHFDILDFNCSGKF